MPAQEFKQWRQKTLLGVSLKMLAPTGQYNPAKLVNWGANRWAFKPELGLSKRWNNWFLDSYAGVWFYCNMEEGSLRCDANVSVRPRGEAKFGTKVEVKNLNSFRYLSHALEFEIERQIGVLESGGSVTQETRLWNVAGGRTESMRLKEFAHDYRYFPDPDLLPVMVMEPLVAEVRRGMPELPAAKRGAIIAGSMASRRMMPRVLTANRVLSGYFESTVSARTDIGKSCRALDYRVNFSGTQTKLGFEAASTAVSPAASGSLIGKVVRVGEITAAHR